MSTSTVLTIRIGAELQRSLNAEARRRHTTRSALVRELLAAGLGEDSGATELAEEARRQSERVSRRASEERMLDFLEHSADTRGWE